MFKERQARRRAHNLLDDCSFLALSCFQNFNNKFDCIKRLSFNVEEWDFFMTVAAVVSAISILDGSESDKEFETFSHKLKCSLDAWHVNGYTAYSDLSDYLQSRNNSDGSIGLWVLMNLKRESTLNEEEIECAVALERFLLIGTYQFDWWRKMA